jgi:hypothetical protein
MLGRLQMTVQECLDECKKFLKALQNTRGPMSKYPPMTFAGGIRTMFDSANVKRALIEIIERSNINATGGTQENKENSDYQRVEDELLRDGDGRDPACKVYAITQPSNSRQTKVNQPTNCL